MAGAGDEGDRGVHMRESAPALFQDRGIEVHLALNGIDLIQGADPNEINPSYLRVHSPAAGRQKISGVRGKV